MTVAEIKNDLHRMVAETDDPSLLKAVKEVFIAMKEKQTGEWWDLLSEEEKQLVISGEEQAHKTTFIPNTRIRNKIELWMIRAATGESIEFHEDTPSSERAKPFLIQRAKPLIRFDPVKFFGRKLIFALELFYRSFRKIGKN